MGPEELSKGIEDGKFGPKADPKERTKALRENPEFEMDENACRKIWAWGPETDGPNLVVDMTQGVQYINEIKEHVNSAFQWTAKEGPRYPVRYQGRDPPCRFHPPRCRPDHAANSPMLFCSRDGCKANLTGASLPGRDHVPTRGDERSVCVHEHASWLRLRREPA